MSIIIRPQIEIETEYERCHECGFRFNETDQKRPDAADLCLIFTADIYNGLRCDDCMQSEEAP